METATLMMVGKEQLPLQAKKEVTGLMASSGERCPCSGEWEIVGTVSTTAVLAKGKVMPEYYGKKVVWMLVRCG